MEGMEKVGSWLTKWSRTSFLCVCNHYKCVWEIHRCYGFKSPYNAWKDTEKLLPPEETGFQDPPDVLF